MELTPAKREAIIASVRRGLTRAIAAQAAGISQRTLYKWLAAAKAGEPDLAQFAHEIKQAEAEGESELLGIIRGHAADTWQAAAWLLERRYPSRYAQRQRVTHEVQLTEDQARAKYREMTGKDWEDSK